MVDEPSVFEPLKFYCMYAGLCCCSDSNDDVPRVVQWDVPQLHTPGTKVRPLRGDETDVKFLSLVSCYLTRG